VRHCRGPDTLGVTFVQRSWLEITDENETGRL
jgi:hypothetical protein